MNNYHLIVKSFRTLIEMFESRHYDTSTHESVNESMITESMVQNACNKGFEIKINNVVIIFYLPLKFKMVDLKKIVEDNATNICEHEQPKVIILVINEKLSINNIKILNNIKTGQCALNYQVFHIKELQFNISKHVLVPIHTIITKDEEKELFEMYSLKSKFQLPIILKTDPMSRYLGLKSGDIVKITRNSPSSGDYYIFRCCI
jgi:DNA-directed RNA polymerase subunit H (RpoH/RPB5)